MTAYVLHSGVAPFRNPKCKHIDGVRSYGKYPTIKWSALNASPKLTSLIKALLVRRPSRTCTANGNSGTSENQCCIVCAATASSARLRLLNDITFFFHLVDVLYDKSCKVDYLFVLNLGGGWTKERECMIIMTSCIIIFLNRLPLFRPKIPCERHEKYARRWFNSELEKFNSVVFLN